MARALRDTRIHGVITNRDLLVGILREPEFRAGAINTGYLERHDPATLMGTDGEASDRTHAVVAALAAQGARRADAVLLPGLPSGWRTLPSQPQMASFTSGDTGIEVSYRFERATLTVSVGDWHPDVQVISASGSLVDAVIDGVRRRYRVTRSGAMHFVDSALGSTALHETERFPDPSALAEAGSLLAPMPGSVVRIEVTEGAPVTAGAPIIVLEAMKMEHTVRAPADGLVASISVAAGDQVDSGQVLAVVHGAEQ
ncbi:MAG: propionyl-CoA carboxylase alpha chain [Mycobacterium sp.]|nr:propionyl-CoA carboxylase alpha chain [Mycobacterium sp.]